VYIESLFRFEGVEIEKHIENHYVIKIQKDIFPQISEVVKHIFWKHYNNISLIQRTRPGKIIRLVVIWRKELLNEDQS